MTLHGYLVKSLERYPDRIAVRERQGDHVTYNQLSELSDRLRDCLITLGTKPGDRIGMYLNKSIDSVATIFGILKTGAAYVPVDPGAPATRNAFIFGNCGVKAVVVESRFLNELTPALEAEGADPELLVLDEAGGGHGLRRYLRSIEDLASSETVHPMDESLAYILYTSGSTGKPKGVKISHRNATSFVDWCFDVFEPVPEDRFSSHAPFHFDLSILDIYTAIKAGASLILIDEGAGKNPGELAACIADSEITIWYSAPSILTLLVQFGNLASRDYGSLRTVLFAGEVFPVAHLHKLKALWPSPRYFNLYGPTETNVCTYFEVPPTVPDDRLVPYPIGKVCTHLSGKVVDENGGDVDAGEEGELCIHGPSVTSGYWELPEQTSSAYLKNSDGRLWYRTGDLVYSDENGDYIFVGRRDRMVKKRGNRVELGEVEACLYQHEDILEAAVIATTDEQEGTRLLAHLVTRDNCRLSAIKLKKFCVDRLPIYMLPDAFRYHPSLPKTSTDKIDYQSLIKSSA